MLNLNYRMMISTKKQHIIMISEDHVTLKTDAENTDLITEMNYSSYKTSVYFYCIFKRAEEAR